MCLGGPALHREGSRKAQTLSGSHRLQPVQPSQPVGGSRVQPTQVFWTQPIIGFRSKQIHCSRRLKSAQRFHCTRHGSNLGGLTEHDSMSSIIALCHFCEFHGPSIVMISQACQDHPQQLTTAIARIQGPLNPGSLLQTPQLSSDSLRVVPTVATLADMPQLSSDSLKTLRASQTPSREPSVRPGNPLYRKIETWIEKRKDSEGCEGCWSLDKSEDVIVTNDDGRSFVSSQSCLTPQLHNLIRHACIRSISCEVSPNREGPVLFSDPSVATVLSHSFFLKDSKARGFKRYYSLILISKEKQHLITSWDLVVGRFSKIIQLLQAKADRKYLEEIGEVMENKKLQEKIEMGCVAKENYYRRRGSSKPARNLRELTMDLNIFYNIHQQNVETLCEMEKNLHESILTGQPTKSGPIETAKIEVILNIIDQIGVSDFKHLALCLFSGKLIQIKSCSKTSSQEFGQCLSALLPTTLQNQNSFANIVFLGQDEKVPGTVLEVSKTDNKTLLEVSKRDNKTLLEVSKRDNKPVFSFLQSQVPEGDAATSVIKLSRILTCARLPLPVKQMSLKTLSEQLVSQTRIFSCITSSQDRKKFLTNIGCTKGDEAIFNFFAMYM